MDTSSTDIDRLAAVVAERLTSGVARQGGGPPSLEEQALEKLTYEVMRRVAARMRPLWLVDARGCSESDDIPAAGGEADASMTRMAERLLGEVPGFPKTPIEVERIEI